MMSLPRGDDPVVSWGGGRGVPRLSPIKAAAVCSTTLARAWEPSLLSVLAPLFAPAVPPRWFVPQLSLPRVAADPMAGGAVRE
jgi:hypothetical protein